MGGGSVKVNWRSENGPFGSTVRERERETDRKRERDRERERERERARERERERGVVVGCNPSRPRGESKARIWPLLPYLFQILALTVLFVPNTGLDCPTCAR